MVGARALHVLSNLSYYTQNPGDIFAIWHGGLSSFGGLLFAVPTGIVLTRRRCPELPMGRALDLVAPVLLACWALGRLLGPQLMVAGGGHPTHQWFGMYYAGQAGRRLPVPIFQALEDFTVYLILIAIERRLDRWPDGSRPDGLPARNRASAPRWCCGASSVARRAPLAGRGRTARLRPRTGGRRAPGHRRRGDPRTGTSPLEAVAAHPRRTRDRRAPWRALNNRPDAVRLVSSRLVDAMLYGTSGDGVRRRPASQEGARRGTTRRGLRSALLGQSLAVFEGLDRLVGILFQHHESAFGLGDGPAVARRAFSASPPVRDLACAE